MFCLVMPASIIVSLALAERKYAPYDPQGVLCSFAAVSQLERIGLAGLHLLSPVD